ncbi:NADP-dependent oxidoreductase [Chitinophaga filiformis]|uniref:NADP-dependent oxidoreductase n=1 Tax=Chitinophaga filiformis TaxID=104663 RepID=UPI001F3C652F|nr:NADP-dependent oxidoreductase [Chitinophaga filiformis]MCF6405065.1 NADP-dependent oxidoreductase [Chitinophaga filiformis]
MKAIILKAPGSVEQLEYSDIEKPHIGAGEVLVKVKAISINPVDVKTREGKGMYGMINTQKPLILGWDIAGTVEQSESDLFRPGDNVFGMVNFPGHGKAYAEYVAAPASQLALKPSNVSFEQAAAATLVALTVWQAMKARADVQKGQKVLVHAASGGVGHIAIQIAKYLGAEVTGTSSAKNRDFVLGLGADSHFDYQGYDWASHPHKYDFVLDTIGGDNFHRSIDVTKAGGTIISIPTSLDEQVTEKAKAKGINGSFMLVKSNGKDMEQIASLLEKGIIDPYVSRTFTFDQMREAHLQMESGRTVGKIVIVL